MNPWWPLFTDVIILFLIYHWLPLVCINVYHLLHLCNKQLLLSIILNIKIEQFIQKFSLGDTPDRIAFVFKVIPERINIRVSILDTIFWLYNFIGIITLHKKRQSDELVVCLIQTPYPKIIVLVNISFKDIFFGIRQILN